MKPDSRRKSNMKPVYKGKGDVRLSGNKLLEHGVKINEKIVEKGRETW